MPQNVLSDARRFFFRFISHFSIGMSFSKVLNLEFSLEDHHVISM